MKTKASGKKKTGGKRGVKKNADDLNIKEQKFCREYVKDENGTRAAIAAGYAERSAAAAASRLLKKVKIQEEIVKVGNKICDDLEITVDLIAREIYKVAFSDRRKLYNDDGSLKMMSELDDDIAACIEGMEVTELFEGKDVPDGAQQKTIYGVLKKVQTGNKLKALELLGRWRKMFTDKVEHSGTLTLEQLVAGE